MNTPAVEYPSAVSYLLFLSNSVAYSVTFKNINQNKLASSKIVDECTWINIKYLTTEIYNRFLLHEINLSKIYNKLNWAFNDRTFTLWLKDMIYHCGP